MRPALVINSMSAEKKPAVSLVIPVYNAVRHIEACLASVAAQKLKDLQIICVDDGSRDGSANVISNIASADPRIELVSHESNLGEGASRNTGIRKARGDYVFHLDADDTLPAAALALLYDRARQHGSDMVRGSFEKIHPDGRREPQQWPIPPGDIINTSIGQSPLLQQVPPSHCAYLYRREFLEEHRLCYPEDLLVGLDLVALTQALLAAERVTIVPDVVYHYHQSPTSVTRGPISQQVPLDAIAARGWAVNLLWQSGFETAALDRLSRWAFDIRRYWARMPSHLSMSEISQVFTEVRTLLKTFSATPWRQSTAHHHRYLLALVIDGQDEKARDFLASGAASAGFPGPSELRDALSFVLQVAPGDEGAQLRLKQLSLQLRDSR